MKKLFLFLFVSSIITAQKKVKNGTIYIDHPGIELINEFNEAFVNADTITLDRILDEKVKIKNGKITLDPPLWIIQSDTVKQMYSMPALEKWAKHSHGNFKNTDYADQVHFMHPTKRQYIKFSELYPVNSTLVLAYKKLLDQ